MVMNINHKFKEKDDNVEKEKNAKKTTSKKTTNTSKNVKPKQVEKKEEKIVKTETVLDQSKNYTENYETRKRIIYVALFIVILLLALLFVLVKKVPKLENGKEVVASVDGKEFTTEELYEKIKKQYGTQTLINMIDGYIADKEIETTDEAKEYANNQLTALKNQYAQYGYDFEKDLKAAGYSSEQDLLDEMILEYKKQEALVKFVEESVKEEEIKDYYEANIYGPITAKHILITPEVTSDMTEEQKNNEELKALNTAKDIIEKLNNGENFDELVKQYSDDEGSKNDNGLISNFTKVGETAVVEEFWNAAYNLENNKYTTSPVQSKFGYHIILKVSSEERPTLESVKETITETIANERLTEDANLSVTAWAELRKKYNLTINDDIIKNSYESTINSYK